ncbi:MAG TPA: hypothetical protein VK137_01240, partial [Planctomycetaceae bacterium]|nr:hypothetical protein [Planctomycetaceae bacterium]
MLKSVILFAAEDDTFEDAHTNPTRQRGRALHRLYSRRRAAKRSPSPARRVSVMFNHGKNIRPSLHLTAITTGDRFMPT